MSELFIQGRQNNKLYSEFDCANCSVRSTKIFPIFRLFHDNRILMILARNNIIKWCQIDQKPKWTDLSAMHKFGRKTPSILSLNLISLGDLFKPSKGAFSQGGINM